MTPVFDLCADHVSRYAVLDPIHAGLRGIDSTFVAAADLSPDGYEARADAIRSTLAALAKLAIPATAEPNAANASNASATNPSSAANPSSASNASVAADRLAANYLRERLEAQLAWHEIGEPLRNLSAQFGMINSIHDSVGLLPVGDDDRWHNVAARLSAVPLMLRSWRRSLDAGLSRGTPAARRQAVEAVGQAEKYIGTHEALVRAYGDGPVAADLARGALAADAGYAEIARYLRDEYAPRAAPTDGVGADRHAVNTRMSLGADIDPRDAYEWGWAELERIEKELAEEVNQVRPGASVEEVTAFLDSTEFVDGRDAYRNWLQHKHDWAIEQLHGVHFDIAAPLHTVDVTLAVGSTSAAAYYTAPSEDLTRPGRTWWPVGERSRFSTWSDLSTVFHEGVPGHHLQNGAVRVAGDSLSRFARTTNVSGHSEGWALYAERLADELGWFTEPGTRLGMLSGSALRAARVVIDIGVHLDLPLPDGSRWTFPTACDVLRTRGRADAHRVHAEVVRYFGWPAQAISYKLGERAWMAARAEAQRRPGFDLKRWHTAALALGPIGLAGLVEALSAAA